MAMNNEMRQYSQANNINDWLKYTVTPLLGGPVIKWTPSIKRTQKLGPDISVFYFPL